MADNNVPAVAQKQSYLNLFDPDVYARVREVAKIYIYSELVPEMYRVTTENTEEKAISNTIIALNIANRINADALMVMQNLTIIYGKPSWSSKMLIGMINDCGKFENLQFTVKRIGTIQNYQYSEYVTEWKTNPQTGKKFKDVSKVQKTLTGPIENFEFVAFTTRKNSDVVLEGSPVSIEMAINEGWYTKAGSKWPNMPIQMGKYRAASFWASVFAPELSLGFKTEEEVRDIVDLPPTDYEVQTNSAKPTGKAAPMNEKEVADEIKANANKSETIEFKQNQQSGNSEKQETDSKIQPAEENKELKPEDLTQLFQQGIQSGPKFNPKQ